MACTIKHVVRNLDGVATQTSPRESATRRQEVAGERLRVGTTLRTIRELRGATTKQLAEAMGIGHDYLNNIENGHRRLTGGLLARAAEFLVVPQLAILQPDSVAPDGTDQ